ncbi:MAG: serine hydrolase [Chthoniobacteraceae bacterium]
MKKWGVLVCLLGFSLNAFGLNETALRRAATYSEERGGFTMLVMDHGSRVFEQYAKGVKENDACKIFSGTKGFWVLATLAAVKEGILALDEPASATLAEWRNDPHRKHITIRQLMSCTSGLAPNSALQRHDLPDANAAALITPVVAAPGRAFTYGPSHYQILCEILRRKLERLHTKPFSYLESRVLDPLDITLADHYEDPAGNPLFATSFIVTARDWAKVGELILQKGRYGVRQIVEPGLLAQCFKGTRANPSFGMGFWNNRPAADGSREVDIEDTLEPAWSRENWHGVCLAKGVPSDLVVSLGSGYQRLYVIPSRGLVIVRQGHNAHFSDGAFLRMVLAGLR